MNATLHLDLLNEAERYSSNPIRLRVMLPLLAVFTALGLGLWWSLCTLRLRSQAAMKGNVEKELAGLKPSHNALLALRAQEGSVTATARQIQLYKNARVCFGEALSSLARSVPDNIQLTELRILPPPAPLPADPKLPFLGPTNTFEAVTLKLSGRTTGERSSEAVNALLASLRTPAFTNLILSAEIPKGAFRQDLAKDPSNREALLFELTCKCTPRRFE